MLIVTNENQSSGLHTRFFDCCWVDALKATVGNSFRRYLIHFSTMSFDTKSMTRRNVSHVRVCEVTNSWKWWSKIYVFLPILLSTKTIFLFVPLWITACSTWGHLQPRGSRASKTSKITSDASITYEKKNIYSGNKPLRLCVWVYPQRRCQSIFETAPSFEMSEVASYLFKFPVIRFSWVFIFKIDMFLQRLHICLLWIQSI